MLVCQPRYSLPLLVVDVCPPCSTSPPFQRKESAQQATHPIKDIQFPPLLVKAAQLPSPAPYSDPSRSPRRGAPRRLFLPPFPFIASPPGPATSFANGLPSSSVAMANSTWGGVKGGNGGVDIRGSKLWWGVKGGRVWRCYSARLSWRSRRSFELTSSPSMSRALYSWFSEPRMPEWWTK